VPNSPIATSGDVIVFSHIHAKDVDPAGYQGDEIVDWATATLHVQHLDRLQPLTQAVISEGLLDLADDAWPSVTLTARLWSAICRRRCEFERRQTSPIRLGRRSLNPARAAEH